jgi:serine kinase of HPr protein (carbohydrate metabolism regulator)
VSALRQASCVAVGGRAILIEGPPGAGKSTLALALIDRGAELIGDDGVTLERRDDALWASPPPNIAGLIEVRNVGLVTLAVGEAPVALLLRLSGAAPRLPERALAETILGCAIPALAFFACGPIPAQRAELALAAHGLPLPA